MSRVAVSTEFSATQSPSGPIYLVSIGRSLDDNEHAQQLGLPHSFSQIVEKTVEDIELDRAALYLAGEEFPDLDVTANLAELDALASQNLPPG